MPASEQRSLAQREGRFLIYVLPESLGGMSSHGEEEEEEEEEEHGYGEMGEEHAAEESPSDTKCLGLVCITSIHND